MGELDEKEEEGEWRGDAFVGLDEEDGSRLAGRVEMAIGCGCSRWGDSLRFSTTMCDVDGGGFAGVTASSSLMVGNPGGLTLCVRRWRLSLLVDPGTTGRGARIPGTERDDRCPHPTPPAAAPPVLTPNPDPMPPNPDDEVLPCGKWLRADQDDAPLEGSGGKKEGRGTDAPGGGPGEPLEMDVERGRPRVMTGETGGGGRQPPRSSGSIWTSRSFRGRVSSSAICEGKATGQLRPTALCHPDFWTRGLAQWLREDARRTPASKKGGNEIVPPGLGPEGTPSRVIRATALPVGLSCRTPSTTSFVHPPTVFPLLLLHPSSSCSSYPSNKARRPSAPKKALGSEQTRIADDPAPIGRRRLPSSYTKVLALAFRGRRCASSSVGKR